MLAYSDLKKGVKIILDKQVYEIIEASHLFKGRGHSVLRAKLKNLTTGNLISKTFHPSDIFEEAELLKIEAKFMYFHKDKFFFCEKENPAKRFNLSLEQINEQGKFLKPNQIVEGMIFEDKVINISLPIKLNLKVVEAPPGIKGGRTEPGTKSIVLETKAKINAPLFIKEGDVVEINTQTGEYVRRVEED